MYRPKASTHNTTNPSEYLPEVTDESEYDDSPLISGGATTLPGKWIFLCDYFQVISDYHSMNERMCLLIFVRNVHSFSVNSN